jgi:hypothetical protein
VTMRRIDERLRAMMFACGGTATTLLLRCVRV